ncbi:uncharacterized protein LOC110721831 [Chenopodium quinoa]|uniref:SAUR family protein n=1 Tax=Chenopodium quinoa TaxID=63459 RepID=A0A803MF91_CHEQI|nr:uncharacterized protein LOC110721831 [Chenopodium quinoa]XP_021756723.1 uncharacterized protein LOC110721831 [Chenopodium quinoa]
MDEQGNGKLGGIRQIVRLKELLQKWQNVTLNSRLPDQNDHLQHAGIAPEVTKRLKNSAVGCDSDEEGCPSPEPPPDVPKGYLAVYVGSELRRFIIPTDYLSHHLFKVLLEKAEEEFGFDHGGALTIPCDTEIFKYLLKCIENENMKKGEHPAEPVEESA